MKLLLVLSVLLVSALAATIPSYEPITTYQESLKVAANDLQSRIVNGFPAELNQIPHQVSVLSPVGNGFSVCGGSIISNRWVITAAHCTAPHRQYILRFGTLALFAGGTAQTSFNAINHPQYNPFNLNNDVSIVSIPTPLNFNPAVNYVRLPSRSQQQATFLNFQSKVSGWGRTEIGTGVSQILRWVFMRVISNQQCANVYGSSVVVSHVVCALGYNALNQAHCSGDSGGPLTIQEGDQWTQIGVVSFGAAAGCHIGLPSGYMRTSHFLDWVSGHTQIPIRN